MRITNSVFRNTAVGLSLTGSYVSNEVDLAFNTFVFSATDGSAGLSCGGRVAGRLENNIIVAPPTTEAVSGTTCTVVHNVLQPGSNMFLENIDADPQFVDVVRRHLRIPGHLSA